MKKIFIKITVAILAIFIIAACAKENTAPEVLTDYDIPEETLIRFVELGFDVSDIKMVGENYLLEGDIIITPKALANMTDPIIVPGPRGEQFHTFNLVTGLPRVITVKGRNLNGSFSTALNNTIASYNNLGLDLTFVRNDNASNPDITVNLSGGSAGGVAGFPDGSGDPYPSATIFRSTKKFGTAVVTHVMTHEIGHCIGLRHTDWFNRSYSCGSGGSEGQQTTGVGAVHIPGTPNVGSYSPGSVMNSCFNSGSTGAWNGDDQTALDFLY